MRKYLTKAEATELQQANKLLTKDQLISKIKNDLFILNPDPCFVIKFIDYRGNQFAPEPFAYYVSYKDILEKRVSGIYWPDSVGFQ